MYRHPNYRREIEVRPSMRSYALNALLRLTMGKPLTDDDDVFALRGQYERLPDLLRRWASTDPSLARLRLVPAVLDIFISLYDTVVVFDKIRENTHELTNTRLTYSAAANTA